MFPVLTALRWFLQFPVPDHLDPGDAIPPVAYVSTVSSILGIISDATYDYSTQMVRKRKYIYDISTDLQEFIHQSKRLFQQSMYLYI